MFEKITRKKVRFESVRGCLSIEDLWDLPLLNAVVNLDDMAKKLSKALKENEESFVKPKKKDESLELLKLKFKAVKYIIGVKLKEEEAKKEEVQNKVKYNKIVNVIEEKEIDELKGKSAKELKKELKKYKKEEE